MDKALLTLLSRGEGFLLALTQHEQDDVIAQLGIWQKEVQAYVANMPEHSSAQAQQKGESLLSLAKRLEQAFLKQVVWVQQQQAMVKQQHIAAQKYTKNT